MTLITEIDFDNDIHKDSGNNNDNTYMVQFQHKFLNVPFNSEVALSKNVRKRIR